MASLFVFFKCIGIFFEFGELTIDILQKNKLYKRLIILNIFLIVQGNYCLINWYKNIVQVLENKFHTLALFTS